MRRLPVVAAAVIGLLLGLVGWMAPAAAHTRPVFDVRDYGATGDGTTNDSPAADAAIAAANAAGGGIVEFPAGTYLAGSSIHLRSDVTIRLDAGATVLGAASGYDPPEPNPNDEFQDFGHSHFHDAMFWGDRLSHIGFVGSGTIDGGGHLITGNPEPGQADKIISLTRCHDLTVSGITLRRGGHFAMLINGCDRVRSDHLTIDTASDRDGWNIISTTNVHITHITAHANDDALVFKSDWALGKTLPNGNVTVDDAHLSAGCCNALMFGSETCGSFTNYHFSHIVITGAGKSGLGMVSMDGAHISNVHYEDVVMSNTQSPIMEKIGTRLRCGGSPSVGGISDIHYVNVTGTGAGRYSPTLWGQPGHPISDVTFENVHLTLPGGQPAMDPNQVPSDSGDYNPNSIGTRPAYGFYLHNVRDVSYDDSSVALAADDARPAFIVNSGSSVAFHDVTAQRGTESPFDVGFQDVAGYCLTGSTTSDGGRLRVSTPGSTARCTAGLDVFSLGVDPPDRTADAGTATSYTVHTGVEHGDPGPVTLTASGAPPGAAVSFAPNPVTPGATSTMTVTTPGDATNGTYHLSVVGADDTATQYASADVTVTGGTEPLRVTDLSVADADNAADWSVQANLRAGDQQYGDRSFTLTSVPASLAGSAWIRTANDSKSAAADPLATFTVSKDATVLVGVDTRIGRRPWMDAGWVDTGMRLGNSESSSRAFELYAENVDAGQVAIGPNADPANGSSMYTVVVTERANS